MKSRSATRLVVVLAALSMAGAAAERRPNIVLIVSDDQGYGDASCYGSEDLRMTHLDGLAAGGIRFTQFRVNPLCAPTRASLLSGLYSIETGMWRGPSGPDRPSDTSDRRLQEGLRLLPQSLKEAGYATGMFGKWHLGYQSPDVPNDRGFDRFVGFLGGAHPYEANLATPILRDGQPIRDDRHLTDLFTDEAIAFLETHRDEPFFCYVPYNAVHGPLWRPERPKPSAKPEYLERCERRGIDFPRRDYCATLEHMDDGVGRILETLRRLGLEDQTLVIFVSDNGAQQEQYPGDNGPLRGQKGMVTEGGIRVPAVIRWPGVIPPGTVSDAPAMAFDLFATCLDAARVDIPQTNGRHPVRGVSLLDHVRSGGMTSLPDRHLFWDLWGKLAAYHDGWKLVGEIPNHRGRFAAAVPEIEAARFELYDLPNDIGERHDLAADEPAVYADLKRRLVDWFRESTR